MTENEWRQIGDQIKDSVDSAIQSGDFSNLSRSIGDVINDTIDTVKDSVKENMTTTYARNLSKKRRDEYEAPYKLTNEAIPEQAELFNRKPSRGSAIAMSVLGIVGFIGFLIPTLAITATFGFGAAAVIFLILTVLFLAVCVLGFRKNGFLSRYQQYIRKLNNQVYVPLKPLADKVGKSTDFTARDLQKMIDQHLFYEAHVDAENNYLILSDKAYREYVAAKTDYVTRRHEMEKQQQTADLSVECQKLISSGNTYLTHIHMCNEKIPDAEMTSKLNRMEQLIDRIFKQVKVHPEVAPDLNKMMNYYLPTTEKLLDAYLELDNQPVAGENINSTKKEIEGSIDTLNTAFEKLFDKLFADRALDISSDISVLNTILTQEGLKDSDFAVKQ